MATGFYTHSDCLLHEMGAWHPESPSRLQAIDDQLIASRIDEALTHETAPLADAADVLRVHTVEHVDFIRSLIPRTGLVSIDGDTAVNAHSWQAAMRSAGAAVAATDAVISGRFANAFCSVRPPGHHAEPDRSMGFCLFNNLAIAVRRALDVHGLQRVAIIDFDVHHGNGTEAAFAGDTRVLMCGFFQHPFYPYSGTEHPAANMLNLPLPAFTDGATMRDAVLRSWLPRLNAFAPQMVFISAGFDAHREDDLGGMRLVEQDYAWLTTRIVEVAERHAGGRIVSCLEGGYNLSALGRSVVAHVRVLADV
ncbi:MAG: histone deacetylase family protein [Janthinobacterium lividum]